MVELCLSGSIQGRVKAFHPLLNARSTPIQTHFYPDSKVSNNGQTLRQLEAKDRCAMEHRMLKNTEDRPAGVKLSSNKSTRRLEGYSRAIVLLISWRMISGRLRVIKGRLSTRQTSRSGKILSMLAATSTSKTNERPNGVTAISSMQKRQE